MKFAQDVWKPEKPRALKLTKLQPSAVPNKSANKHRYYVDLDEIKYILSKTQLFVEMEITNDKNDE
jgi:hypothetical protein